ncbi:MAG: hypothetical protein ACI4S2_15385 [Lachnospiraceae bacterium]
MPQEENKRPLMQRLAEDASGAVTDLIYEKVNDLLGAGDQLFTMEFPARPLNQNTYRYNADGVYSMLTKPAVITEAEFELSDALYDTAPIVQSGNGEKLSTVYSSLLNNYVPKMDFLKAFVTDKEHLRKWLLTEVPDISFDENNKPVSSETKISRMELCKKLYGIYLGERNKWYKEKNERFNDSKDDAAKLEDYAKWVSSEGLVRDEELNNLFNDAVVRGNYHEVMTILGFLNVESPAETLEKTKQNMRACEKRSLDGSGLVYPVQFQPTDWFKALTPNLHPKDLTMSAEALVAEYKAKKKALKNLEKRLTELEEGEISSEEMERRKDRAASAKATLAQAEKNSMEKYGNGALEAFRMVIKLYQTVADPAAQFETAIGEIEKVRQDPTQELSGLNKQLYGLLEDCSDQALNAMKENFKQICELTAAAEDAVAAQAEYAASQVQNTASLKQNILSQISDIRDDIDYLTPLVSGTLSEEVSPSGDVPSNTDEEAKSALLPATSGEPSDNTFMDVILTSESIQKKSAEASSSSASSDSWKVSGWFYSAGHNSSSSSASQQQANEADTSRIEIGFRIMKVSIDRGQWFSPNVFKMTQNFYRLSESRCAPGINKDDIRNAIAKTDADAQLKKLLTYSADNKQCSYLLPSYPTAFVIAKDITIRVKVEHDELQENKDYIESQSSTAGGFFGFSATSASSSKNCSESSYVGERNDYIYIRIPGPQILGWFQQLVPLDVSEKYEPMKANPFENVLMGLNRTVTKE